MFENVGERPAALHFLTQRLDPRQRGAVGVVGVGNPKLLERLAQGLAQRSGLQAGDLGQQHVELPRQADRRVPVVARARLGFVGLSIQRRSLRGERVALALQPLDETATTDFYELTVADVGEHAHLGDLMTAHDLGIDPTQLLRGLMESLHAATRAKAGSFMALAAATGFAGPRLGLRVGDRFRVGQTELTVAGVIAGTAFGLLHALLAVTFGVDQAMLYVDEDNVPAIRMYEGLGFTRATVDAMYRRGAQR